MRIWSLNLNLYFLKIRIQRQKFHCNGAYSMCQFMPQHPGTSGRGDVIGLLRLRNEEVIFCSTTSRNLATCLSNPNHNAYSNSYTRSPAFDCLQRSSEFSSDIAETSDRHLFHPTVSNYRFQRFYASAEIGRTLNTRSTSQPTTILLP